MEQGILYLAVGIIGGVFGGLLYRLASEYFERKCLEIKPENVQEVEYSLLSQYQFAVARVYEDKDDKGFPIMTIKPISMCEDEKEAVNGAREQREYEREVIRTNPICDLKNYWNPDNIRAIKIYEAD